MNLPLSPASIKAVAEYEPASVKARIAELVAKAKRSHSYGMTLRFGIDQGYGDQWEMTDMMQGEFASKRMYLRQARRLKKAAGL